MKKATSFIVIAAALVVGNSGQVPTPPAKDYEAVSLLGTKLAAGPPDPAAVERYEKARADFARDPSEENTIWLGRRAAYVGRYREAVAVYSQGLARFPKSYRLLRHRGHRYLSTRQFVKAAADFEQAAVLVRSVPLEVEADGVPNKAGVPVSNTQFNVFYHLGLAHYLAGDWAKAEAAYRECLAWSKNDDSVVATTDWLYLTLRRAGKTEAAAKALEAVAPRMNVLENGAYFRRLLMYKGDLAPEALLLPKPDETESELRANAAVYEYGLAQRDLWRGDPGAARNRFEKIIGGGGWPAFASIAAEADLARLILRPPDLSTPENLLRAWTAFWNSYDLDGVPALFAPGEEATYFSSEKAGMIVGREALVEHHRSFGFAPGGQNRDSRLWLEGIRTNINGPTARVAARWLFDRDVTSPAPAQSGPVTFVLVRESGTGAWRIVHAHFSNDPPAK